MGQTVSLLQSDIYEMRILIIQNLKILSQFLGGNLSDCKCL